MVHEVVTRGVYSTWRDDGFNAKGSRRASSQRDDDKKCTLIIDMKCEQNNLIDDSFACCHESKTCKAHQASKPQNTLLRACPVSIVLRVDTLHRFISIDPNPMQTFPGISTVLRSIDHQE